MSTPIQIGLTDFGKNRALDTGVASVTNFISILDGDPASGGNEIGSRIAVNFNAPSAGSMQTDSNYLIPVDATSGSVTVRYLAIWDSLTGGNMVGIGAVNPTDPNAGETFVNSGSYDAQSIIIRVV